MRNQVSSRRRVAPANNEAVRAQGSEGTAVCLEGDDVVHACILRIRHARSPQRVARDKPNRALACISRPRHARSPQRVAPDKTKSHPRLHFTSSTRTISEEGCAGQGQIALSPARRVLDTHDLRRGLRWTGTNRTLACTSRPRHARSPQRVAPDRDKSHSRLHFAHSTRTISAEGCPRDRDKSHSRLHFVRSTRTVPAEGCPRPGQIALSPAFRASDTHDLRQRIAFRGGPAALPPALREKVKKSER